MIKIHIETSIVYLITYFLDYCEDGLQLHPSYWPDFLLLRYFVKSLELGLYKMDIYYFLIWSNLLDNPCGNSDVNHIGAKLPCLVLHNLPSILYSCFHVEILKGHTMSLEGKPISWVLELVQLHQLLACFAQLILSSSCISKVECIKS